MDQDPGEPRSRLKSFVLRLVPVLGAVHSDGHENLGGRRRHSIGRTQHITQGREGPQEAGGTGVARRRPEHRRVQLAPASHLECCQQAQGPNRRPRGGGREGLERKGGGILAGSEGRLKPKEAATWAS